MLNEKTKKGYGNQFILMMILTFAFTATSMMSASQPILVNIPVNIILPIAIMIFGRLVFFERLKLTTLTFLRIVVIFAVFNILDRQLFVNIVLIFLAINILEATLSDLFRYKRYLNGITGLVLTASIFFLRGTWLDLTSLSELGFFAKFFHLYEFHTASLFGTICWIIAYTIWNWVFVTNEFSPAVAKLHLGILASPILGSIICGTPAYWLTFRASSLSFGGCFQIMEKEFIESNLKSDGFTRFVEKTKTAPVQIVLCLINIVLIVLACVVK